MVKATGIRRALYAVVSILLVIGAATFFIGNYFVDFALVPGKGGQDRVVQSAEPSPSEGPQSIPAAKAAAIQATKEQERRAADRWAASLGELAKDVQVEADDGVVLKGHQWLQARAVPQWAVVVHGYQSDESEAFVVGRHFYERGYNVLTMDLRAHGRSGGDFIGMGVLDSRDLLVWLDDLVRSHPEAQIVLHGTSMGGATVLMTGALDMPPNVKAIISDSAYTSVWDIFGSELRARFGLPPFPVLNMAETMARVRAGYTFHDPSPLRAVGHIEVPLLLVHGNADDFVPVAMAHQLAEAAPADRTDLLIIDQAGHSDGKYADPDAYYRTMTSFLNEKAGMP